MPRSQGFTLGYSRSLPPGGTAFIRGRNSAQRVRMLWVTDLFSSTRLWFDDDAVED
jgi:hypothetical protein